MGRQSVHYCYLVEIVNFVVSPLLKTVNYIRHCTWGFLSARIGSLVSDVGAKSFQCVENKLKSEAYSLYCRLKSCLVESRFRERYHGISSLVLRPKRCIP